MGTQLPPREIGAALTWMRDQLAQQPWAHALEWSHQGHTAVRGAPDAPSDQTVRAQLWALLVGVGGGGAAVGGLPGVEGRLPLGELHHVVGGAVGCDRCGSTMTHDSARGLMHKECRGCAMRHE